MKKRNLDRYRKRNKERTSKPVTDKLEALLDTGEGLLSSRKFRQAMSETGMTASDFIELSEIGRLPVKGVTQEMVDSWMAGFTKIPNPVAKYLLFLDTAIQNKVTAIYNEAVEDTAEENDGDDDEHHLTFVKYNDAKTYRKFHPNTNVETTFGVHNKIVDSAYMKLKMDGIKSTIITFDEEDYLAFLDKDGKSHSRDTLVAWMAGRYGKLLAENETAEEETDDS
jgi:hypothetical protein